VTNTDIARDAILEDLRIRFQANDKTVKPLDPKTAHHWWNVGLQKNCYSGSGIMQCPICKVGKLRYSRNSYNGHVHAACSTKECVRWME
jgi:hypothetical protein